MVVVMFVWQRLEDARGEKRYPCSLRDAMKSSGYAREYLVSPKDTGRFWNPFVFVTLMYAAVLAVWDQLLKPVFGLNAGITINSLIDLSLFILPGLLLGFAFGLLNKLYGWRSANAAVRAMTRAGLCPSCAYRIDEIQSEPDGCTVCPECGGAWMVHEMDGTLSQE